MKHLREFSDFKDLVEDCKDILIDLLDDGIIVRVFNEESDLYIRIYTDRVRKGIRIGKYELCFNHLLSYLEERGYYLDKCKDSYITTEDEESLLCPRCGDDWIVEEEGGIYFGCTSCLYSSRLVDFLSQKTLMDDERFINLISQNKEVININLKYIR